MIGKQWAITAMAVMAGAALTAEAETNGMVHTIAVGATLTDGNSDTRQATVSLLSEGEKPKLGSIRTGVEGRYGESEVDGDMEKTMENVRAFLDARKTLNERLYGFLNTTYLYDKIADIDYRIAVSMGPGWYLVKTDSTALSVEFGPGYVFERIGNDDRDYPALRAAERFEHKFSENARVWQSVEYLPKVTDFELYLINAELGAESAMTKRVNLRFVLQDQYNSEPAEDKEENDLTFIAGISVKL